jgi:hypothetical protein
MATRKRVLKKTEEVVPVKHDKLTGEEYKDIFTEGERLGFDKEKTRLFLERNGISFVKTPFYKIMDFLRNQKALEDFTTDELIRWRGAVRARLFASQAKLKIISQELERTTNSIASAYNKTLRKREKDLQWYNRVSAVLAKKIKGMRSYETFILEP